MSDTPRTDAKKSYFHHGDRDTGEASTLEYVDPEFTRQLERELVKVAKDRDEWLKNNVKLNDSLGRQIAKNEALQSQLSAAQEALNWYGEKAEAASRYLANKQSDAVLAVVTELSLDAGKRSKAIAAAQSGGAG